MTNGTREDWLRVSNNLLTRIQGARHQEELALLLKETAFACLGNGAMPVEMADKVRDHIEDMRGSLPERGV